MVLQVLQDMEFKVIQAELEPQAQQDLQVQLVQPDHKDHKDLQENKAVLEPQVLKVLLVHKDNLFKVLVAELVRQVRQVIKGLPVYGDQQVLLDRQVFRRPKVVLVLLVCMVVQVLLALLVLQVRQVLQDHLVVQVRKVELVLLDQ
jgi:hypothetical protein